MRLKQLKISAEKYFKIANSEKELGFVDTENQTLKELINKPKGKVAKNYNESFHDDDFLSYGFKWTKEGNMYYLEKDEIKIFLEEGGARFIIGEVEIVLDESNSMVEVGERKDLEMEIEIGHMKVLMDKGLDVDILESAFKNSTKYLDFKKILDLEWEDGYLQDAYIERRFDTSLNIDDYSEGEDIDMESYLNAYFNEFIDGTEEVDEVEYQVIESRYSFLKENDKFYINKTKSKDVGEAWEVVMENNKLVLKEAENKNISIRDKKALYMMLEYWNDKDEQGVTVFEVK